MQSQESNRPRTPDPIVLPWWASALLVIAMVQPMLKNVPLGTIETHLSAWFGAWWPYLAGALGLIGFYALLFMWAAGARDAEERAVRDNLVTSIVFLTLTAICCIGVAAACTDALRFEVSSQCRGLVGR